MDEAELLQEAQNGNQRAFGGLIKLHETRVSACAIKMLHSVAEAEDAVQETFIRAWRAIGRFDGRSKLSTWMYRICVNVCLNAIRRRKNKKHVDFDDPAHRGLAANPTQGSSDPARAFEASEASNRLRAALGRLSPSLRSAVILVLVEGLGHREAGEVLGVPEGTIAWRIHEARRRLRADLGDLLMVQGKAS